MEHLINEMNKLNEDDLLILNKLIIERIKSLRSQKSFLAKSSFNLGDYVSYHSKKKNKTISGKIIKINKKTADIQDEYMSIWRVDMGYLKKCIEN